MKLLICLTLAIALLPMLAQAQTANETQATEELNEAARAYRAGKFAEAQTHSEKALQLDPQNKKAPYFIARCMHAQYKPGDYTLENVSRAREAIIAYQKILERIPGDEESYKAVAYLYGAIKEDQILREWILQRANDVSMPNDKRAEAFTVLASKDWDCSFQVTELPANKITTVNENKRRVSYRMPKERVEFDKAKECANHGLEMANTAITLTPEKESAWSYKTNILLELAKLAEMSGDESQKREFQLRYEEALKETTRISNRARPNP